MLFLSRALDAVPVVSPEFTTGDLVGGKDAVEPLFSDLAARGATAYRVSAAGEQPLDARLL